MFMVLKKTPPIVIKKKDALLKIMNNDSYSSIHIFPVTGHNISHLFPLKKKVMSSVAVCYCVSHKSLDTCLMRSALGPFLMQKKNGT